MAKKKTVQDQTAAAPETAPETKNEVTETPEAQLPANPEDIGFRYQDNFQGGATPRLPQIGVIHQGQMFNVNENKVESFNGIIINYRKCNAFWDPNDDGNVNPLCASSDGFTPDQGDQLQAEKCAACEKNAWKSGKDGRGKACKNMYRCHLKLPDMLLPYRLTVGPTSLRYMDDYITLLSNQKIAYQIANTRFTLEKKESGSNVWSIIKMDIEEKIDDPKQWVEIKAYIKQFASSFGEEIQRDEVGETEGEAGASDNVPF